MGRLGRRLALLAASLAFVSVCAALVGGAVLLSVNDDAVSRVESPYSPLPNSTATKAVTTLPPGVGVLGATREALESVFGAPITFTATDATFQFNTSQSSVGMNVVWEQGTDGTARASAISLVIRAESGTWTAEVAQTVYEPLLPPDAVFVKDPTSAGVAEHVFRSLQLATAFTSAHFVDIRGKGALPAPSM